jgi:protein TonB
VVLALIVEILIVLVLLSLSIAPPQSREEDQQLTVFGVTPEPSKDPVEEESPAPSQNAAQSPEPQEAETDPSEIPSPVVAPQLPSPTPPAIVPMPSIQPAQPQASQQIAKPKANPGRVYGPANKGTPGDTERVGSAPNGEPLYAAAWYREPYDDELSGYLSTARGPGAALIACRTVPDFRVEDCVQLSETPAGSGIGRAVLAAAWQFRVRPPRVGGVSKVGEWVRIRIDYSIRRE